MNVRKGVMVGGALLTLVGLMSAPRMLFGSDQVRAKELVQNTCAGCHRVEGAPLSRLEKKAPDLIGVGSKFKHEWLVSWLAGKEPPLYAKSYRWDQSQTPQPHMAISQTDAEEVAKLLETEFLDPKVTAGAIDMATFSKQEAAFGEKIFREHACIGCHQVREGDKTMGGPQSTSMAEAGKRLKADWIYRFNSNPPDYVPHSGEFVGDVSALGLRYVTGYIATRGWDDFHYYEPWKSEPFGHASPDRGKVIYKEYCAQCHGATGKGDGPAASGLDPKPAIHANIPFEKVPIDYLYNVIYYGGKAVGKSPTMPYWGLTIGQQGVADVMAYLKVTFKGAPEAASAPGVGASGACVQSRKTSKAPDEFLAKTNPLPASAGTIEAGKALFLKTAQPVACAMCHGNHGDGKGFMGAALVPPPRNFTCGAMMKDLPDGQLFWIIKNGSPGTGMMSFAGLPDEQVWQLIHYIRSLAK
ncbi:MAG: c-type cytochrome [Nitrospirota bacterium]|nr:c-type cytochrome [Nitrospirota bacterium]MDP2382032.1 c-type cytochrome [Nitrospirota bacterium]MDP3598308.1 c-type cytochrome [Nitrospirota bacterium]